MKTVQTVLFWAGVAVTVLGSVFLAQGMGWFPYPADSFMVGSQEWVVRGAGAAALGLIIIVVARRLK